MANTSNIGGNPNNANTSTSPTNTSPTAQQSGAFTQASAANDQGSVTTPGTVTTLAAGQKIYRKDPLYSADGRYALVLQPDAYLTFIDTGHEKFSGDLYHTPEETIIWKTGKLDHKDDSYFGIFGGQFVVHDRNGHGWESDTTADGAENHFLRLHITNDGKLELVDDLRGGLVWEVNAQGKDQSPGDTQGTFDYFRTDRGLALTTGDLPLVGGNGGYLQARGRQVGLTHSGEIFTYRKVNDGNSVKEEVKILVETGVVAGELSIDAHGAIVVKDGSGVEQWTSGTGNPDASRQFVMTLSEDGRELQLSDPQDGNRLLWSSSGVNQPALSDADVAFKAEVNNLVDGDTMAQISEDTLYERVLVMWHNLVGDVDATPHFSAQQVLELMMGFYFEEEHGLLSEASQWDAFFDANFIDGSGSFRRLGDFNVSMFGIKKQQASLLEAFEEAALIFYSIQQNHALGKNNELILPPHSLDAFELFANALHTDINGGSNTSDFLPNRTGNLIKDTHWQDFIYSGFYKVKQPPEGMMDESVLANESLVQAISWLGSIVLEELAAMKDIDWIGPSAAMLDHADLAEDKKHADGTRKTVEEGNLAIFDVTYIDSNDKDVRKYVNANELIHIESNYTVTDRERLKEPTQVALHWKSIGLQYGDTVREPTYNSEGGMVSGAPMTARLAQLFKLLYEHKQANDAIKLEEFNDDPLPEGSASYFDFEGTLLKGFTENIPMGKAPDVADAVAIEFMFNKLGADRGENELDSALSAFKGTIDILSTVSMWAKNHEGHDDGHTVKDRLDNLHEVYGRQHDWLVERGRSTELLNDLNENLKKKLHNEYHREMVMLEINVAIFAATLLLTIATAGLAGPAGATVLVEGSEETASLLGTEVAGASISYAAPVAINTARLGASIATGVLAAGGGGLFVWRTVDGGMEGGPTGEVIDLNTSPGSSANNPLNLTPRQQIDAIQLAADTKNSLYNEGIQEAAEHLHTAQANIESASLVNMALNYLLPAEREQVEAALLALDENPSDAERQVAIDLLKATPPDASLADDFLAAMTLSLTPSFVRDIASEVNADAAAQVLTTLINRDDPSDTLSGVERAAFIVAHYGQVAGEDSVPLLDIVMAIGDQDSAAQGKLMDLLGESSAYTAAQLAQAAEAKYANGVDKGAFTVLQGMSSVKGLSAIFLAWDDSQKGVGSATGLNANIRSVLLDLLDQGGMAAELWAQFTASLLTQLDGVLTDTSLSMFLGDAALSNMTAADRLEELLDTPLLIDDIAAVAAYLRGLGPEAAALDISEFLTTTAYTHTELETMARALASMKSPATGTTGESIMTALSKIDTNSAAVVINRVLTLYPPIDDIYPQVESWLVSM
ncbi:MAG: hypothetical protein AAFZ92_03940, partial [Pseudomonadota bacterium]